MTPSEILVAAADRVRDLAAAADDGPWVNYRNGWCILSQPDANNRETWRTVCSEGFTPENGEWISALSPDAGPWLEASFRSAAVDAEEVGADPYLIGLASVILGGEPGFPPARSGVVSP